MTIRPVLLLSASLLAMATPAHAQEAASPEAMRAEIDALKAQLRALEARLDSVAQQQAAAPAPAPTEVAAAAPTPTKAEKATEVTWKGGPELTHPDGWRFKVRGRLQIDAGTVSSPRSFSDTGLGFSNEIRRVRLGAEGDIPGGFGYRVEAEFADNEVEMTDAYLTYGKGPFGVTLGQHNNFQSLDELTSDLFTSFMERAAFTDAFNFERRVGLSAGYRQGAFMANVGVFTDDISALTDDGNNSRSIDARAVWMPKFGDTQLHFGASGHLRDFGDLPGARYRQRPFIHSTDVRFIDTGALGATGEKDYGLELAAVHGPFHFAGETHWLQSELPGAADPTFFGGYAEAGWFITGESRGFKNGAWDRTKPLRSVADGGMGALQVNLRYDYLDLIDAGIVGGKQNGYLASLIWTPIAYMRLGLNYGHLVYDQARALPDGRRDYSVDSFGVRAEIDF
ncbi:OprO/OprP family phosphate-selective porin [Allosphingosinicella indica]|uniref:Phosphate-selective porin OprO and OprP n=1 Tax=Allosphingosinicella indica TaxID=941907 RepID=A0A1X7GI22_9SPHN|nr:porin [Allosphingosinicella indica]SMF69732.1 phosphate-selective porin OprO and OprP [Allosphingosinicella indica]